MHIIEIVAYQHLNTECSLSHVFRNGCELKRSEDLGGSRRTLAALLSLVVLLLCCLFSKGSCGFASLGGRDEPKQVPLSLMREQAGTKFRAKARDAIAPLPMTPAEKKLLRRLAGFSRAGRWGSVDSAFRSYNGSSTAIYNQVMHAAFRCDKYQRGVQVYNRLL